MVEKITGAPRFSLRIAFVPTLSACSRRGRIRATSDACTAASPKHEFQECRVCFMFSKALHCQATFEILIEARIGYERCSEAHLYPKNSESMLWVTRTYSLPITLFLECVGVWVEVDRVVILLKSITISV